MSHEAPELQDIQTRLKRLESENRKLKWGGASLLAVLSSFVLMGQTAPTAQVIEAQRFVLKDTEGNVRAWWGLLGKGSELTLGNVNKQPKMSLKVSEEASDLHFFGEQSSGMNVGVDFGHPAIAMAGADGSGVVDISVPDSGPAMKLRDENGFSAVVGAAQSKDSRVPGAKGASAASFILLDKSGKIIWKAP